MVARPRKYMVASNLDGIVERLDNACSEIWNAIESVSDMNYENLEGKGIDIEGLGFLFENLVATKNEFETLAEDMRDKEKGDIK